MAASSTLQLYGTERIRRGRGASFKRIPAVRVRVRVSASVGGFGCVIFGVDEDLVLDDVVFIVYDAAAVARIDSTLYPSCTCTQ